MTVHSSVTTRYAVDVDVDTLKEAMKEVADMFLADVIRSSSTPTFFWSQLSRCYGQ